MNVFKFELSNLYKSIFKWSFAVSVLSIIYIAFYRILEAQMSDYLKLVPSEMVKLLQLDLLLTFEGYFVFILSYMALALGVQAMWLGMDVFVSDHRMKSIEFLYVKPTSKLNIIKWKFLARLVVMVSTWFCWVVLICLYFSLMSVPIRLQVAQLLMITILISSAIMMSLGMVIGAFFSNSKNTYTLAFAIVLTLFVLNTLVPSFNNSLLSFLALFSYIDTSIILESGTMDMTGLIKSLLLASMSVLLAMYVFRRNKNYIG